MQETRAWDGCCRPTLTTEYEGAAFIPASLARRQSRGAFGIPLLRSPCCLDEGRKKPRPCGAGLLYAQASFDLAGRNVGRTRAFLALSDFEIDRLALIEGGGTRRFDLRMVDKQIFAAVRRGDEAKSLTGIEPFHGTFCHVFFS
jgi:hypothetical protein